MQEDLEDAAAFIAATFISILSQPKSTCQRGWRRWDAAQAGGRAGRRMDIFHPHRQWKQSTAGRRVKSSPSVHSARHARLSRAFWPSSLLPALSLPLSQLEGWALLLSALAAPKKVSQGASRLCHADGCSCAMPVKLRQPTFEQGCCKFTRKLCITPSTPLAFLYFPLSTKISPQNATVSNHVQLRGSDQLPIQISGRQQRVS